MDDERIAAAEKVELMGVGAIAIDEIKKLLTKTSSALRTEFKHGITIEEGDEVEGEATLSAEILLFFTITNLGGSKEEDIEKFVREGVEDIFKDPSMHKFKVQWSFLVKPE